MKISIGIMLWNEGGSIGMTIDSLFQQSLLSEPLQGVERVEVVALANGCTDDSVPNAKAAFQRNLARCPLSCIDARVEELTVPSKANAWNEFVHHLADPEADYLIFTDADVYIDHPDALASMVHGLERSPYHPVAAALGIKDIDLKPTKSAWEGLCSAMTRLEHHARLTYLCGGLYCGRASFFRRLRFPEGFVGNDDAFLARMAITNLMTTPMQFDRILHPPEASFVFEAYTSPSRLFRQHIRRKICDMFDGAVYEFVLEHQEHGVPDAGAILREACHEDPNWLMKRVEDRIAARPMRTIPWSDALLRVSQLRCQPFAQQILKAPLALAGTVWLAAVILAANRRLQRRQISDSWNNAKNTRLLSLAKTPLPAARDDNRKDDQLTTVSISAQK